MASKKRKENDMQRLKRALLLVTIAMLAVATLGAQTTRQHVPNGSVVFVTVSDLGSDPGMSWLLNAWQSSPRESGLRTVFGSVNYSEVSVAVLGGGVSGSPRVLMVASLLGTYPSSAFDAVLQADESQISETTVSGQTVRYIDPVPPGQDFGAYTHLGDVVMLGADRSVVEDALAAGPMAANQGLQAMGSSLDLSSNGLLFADNDDTLFADFLAPLERKWGMSLLLSADQLAWMGSAFDVIDSNTIEGTILFEGGPDASVADIKDDAEFLGEAFRRKFMAEEIAYESQVSVDGSTVELAFQMSGLEPLWVRLFEQGVLSIIQPQ
jgi:hypothetical protein